MPLPASYQRFFRIQLRYALVMLGIGLLAGICFQESGRKVSLEQFGPGVHLEYLLTLAMVHGHTFLMGVLLPLAMAWMLDLGLRLGGPAVPPAALAWTAGLYLPGAALSVALMLYKGYHFVLGARYSALSFAALDGALYGHHPLLRAALAGLAHAAMGLGVGILAWVLWRSLGRGTARA
jgi:hypothetical protein